MSAPTSRRFRSNRSGVQSAKLAPAVDSVSLYASSAHDSQAARAKSAGPRQSLFSSKTSVGGRSPLSQQTRSLNASAAKSQSLASTNPGKQSRMARRSRGIHDSFGQRPTSAPFGSAQPTSLTSGQKTAWNPGGHLLHDEGLVTFDEENGPVTNRPKPRARSAQAWIRKIAGETPLPWIRGETPLPWPVDACPIALRDENLELETPRSPAYVVDLGLSGPRQPLPRHSSPLRLQPVSPTSPSPELLIPQQADDEERSRLTEAAEEQMKRRLQMLDERENRMPAARFRPTNIADLQREHGSRERRPAPARLEDISTKPAVTKISEPSERLLHSKHEKREAIRVKSYRVRLEELNAKISGFRYNKSELEDKIRKTKEAMRRSRPYDCVAGNRLAIHDVHNQQNQAELRVLRALEEELRMLANRAMMKVRKKDDHVHKLLEIEDRNQRKVHRKTLAEREAYESRMTALGMLLLPAFVAASRMSRLAEAVSKRREQRAHSNRVNWAAHIIQRNMRWKHWNHFFDRRIVLKGFMKRNLWFAVFNFRVRRKTRAATTVRTFMKEHYGRQPITVAFARYKYKILVLQRLCRTAMQARRARLDVVHRQWTAVVTYYRDYQNFGMLTQKRVSYTEALKKRLDDARFLPARPRSSVAPSRSPLNLSPGPKRRRSSVEPPHSPVLAPHHPHSGGRDKHGGGREKQQQRGRRQSLYLQHGAAMTRRTGIEVPTDEDKHGDRRRSSCYQPSYVQGKHKHGIAPHHLGADVPRRLSSAEGAGGRTGRLSSVHSVELAEVAEVEEELRPVSWENSHQVFLHGGISAVRGINFFLVPLEPTEAITTMLKDVSRKRMQRFSEDLHEWRMMHAEWNAHKSEYEAEARARDFVHGKVDDHIPSFLAPETIQMKSDVDRATKDYKERKKFYLQDGKALFTWSRWRSKPKGDRKRDVEYRRKGPPRPVYRNLLEEEEELWPLLEKARQ